MDTRIQELEVMLEEMSQERDLYKKALEIAAEEQYANEVVFTDMEDLTEASKEEWTEGVIDEWLQEAGQSK